MRSPDFIRGYIGYSPFSDKVNRGILARKILLLENNDYFGFKTETKENRKYIPQTVLRGEQFDWQESSDGPLEKLTTFLLTQKNGDAQAERLVAALGSPELFCFRAFTRTLETKRRFAALGIRYDREVIDENLETEGAEYSLLLTQEPCFNFSIGNTSALSYFNPSQDTASSYLTVYDRQGIEPLGYYFCGKITDGVPLARKRVGTIRVDWQ